MSRKTIISCGLSAVLAFAAMPVLAQGLESSQSDRSGRIPRSELAPSPGPSRGAAGEAWVGIENITEADINAAGVRLEPEAKGPDPLAPEIAALVGESAPESIINWDSRMRQRTGQYPNRAIVYITYNGNHLCTGFMVADNIVATAGHCVHTGGVTGSWRNRNLMRVYPGRDRTSSPYGSCGVIRQYSVKGWTKNESQLHDYAAQVLDCSIGNTVGWFGLYSEYAGRFFLKHPAIVSGYPGDKEQTQWLSADLIRASEKYRVCYRMDTIGGQSGSPVWNDRDEALATNGAWAFAIHAYAASQCNGNMNSGPRLTAGRVQNYIKWINNH